MRKKTKLDISKRLPHEIGLFCHNKTLVLPGVELNLNVYNIDYLELIEDAIELNYRFFGVVTPTPKRYKNTVGCIAKITSFTEFEDNKFHVTIQGICRFKIEKIIRHKSPYKIAKVDYSEFQEDAEMPNIKLENRQNLDLLVHEYVKIVEKNNLELEKIHTIPDLKLFSFLCNNLNLSASEHLKLLNCKDFSKTQFLIEQATELSIANAESKASIKH